MRTLLAALILLPGLSAAEDMRLPPETARLNQMAARFAPVDIRVDLSRLEPGERRALASLVKAARITDALFMRQMWAGNEATLLRLLEDTTPLGRARLDYYLLNRGPWSQLDDNAVFVPGAPEKPEAANFYPTGATKAEVEAWIGGLEGDAKAAATGFFTTIRRDSAGKFDAVPYSLEYQGELAEMAALLREASSATAEPTLKAFLDARADAFASNDYYASDVAWMKLDAAIEPTIGPYEVYEDGWFNYKAAFEAFITVRDDAESAKLARYGDELQWLEDRLPIDPSYRRKKLGGLAPIRVVNVVFSAGDGNHGVQTAAYNLPNDERIVAEMGSKRMMLKNYQQAKFEKTLVPISKVALAAGEQPDVDFEAFFTHILMHELMHGLGPTNTGPGGTGSAVRPALKELYSTVEEAKADITGLWALQQLMDKGVIDRAGERRMYTTFLASAFRTLRFGMDDAHARGMAMQVNYLLDAGAYGVNADGTFSVNLKIAKKGVAGLAHDLLTLEAKGDYGAAKDMLARLVALRPEVKAVLDRLGDVPVDIRPQFVTAGELAAGFP
jgi:peptidase M49-like protein